MISTLLYPHFPSLWNNAKAKCKAIPVQAWTGPEGTEVWGTQVLRHLTHEGSKVVSPAHQTHLLHRKYSWYSFLLKAELTTGGHSAVRRIMPMKNYSNTIGNWTYDLPASSEVRLCFSHNVVWSTKLFTCYPSLLTHRICIITTDNWTVLIMVKFNFDVCSHVIFYILWMLHHA
jgi:hypothetical protein